MADDRWDDGQAYESYIGRWSRPVAARFAVETVAIEVPTVFVDFDDYWAPFLRATGPAPGYVASLDDHARIALRDRLRSDLPTESDGSFRLVARAWAVRGRAD